MEKVGPNNETLIEYSVNQVLTCDFSKTDKLFIEIFRDDVIVKDILK